MSKTENPYKVKPTVGLPPGTDSYEQLDLKPRLPRAPPKQTRPLPEWPPPEQRKGKWMADYLDKLNPETEFDQIIRTSHLFGTSPFGASLAYAVIICINSQTPAGAAAVHGGSVTREPHARYYRTMMSELSWVFHGSTAPETAKDISRINKIHSGVWKRKPGTFSSVWEGKMTIVGISYFDTWARRVVGACCQTPHPNIQAAYPFWGEQLTSHFVTEPSHGSQSFGNNYPRTWDEVEEFFYWLQDLPYEEQTTPEQKQIGAEAAEYFVQGFCDFWFPGFLQFIGRDIILTFIPPQCRRRQRMGEPNWLRSELIKLVIKLYYDAHDYLLSDPAEPNMTYFRGQLARIDLSTADYHIRKKRGLQDGFFGLSVLALLIGIILCNYSH